MRRELADDWAKAGGIDKVVMLRLVDLSRARLSPSAQPWGVQERRRIEELVPPSNMVFSLFEMCATQGLFI